MIAYILGLSWCRWCLRLKLNLATHVLGSYKRGFLSIDARTDIALGERMAM